MDDNQLISVIGQGGVTAALVAIVWKVGLALVASIKELREEVSEHTKSDLAHHAKVSEQLAELRGTIDGIAYERERTPVGVDMPRRTPPRGLSQVGDYSITSKRGRDDR